MAKKYQTFAEFWPFYVSEHADPFNRKLHFVGTSLALGSLAGFVLTRNPRYLAAAPVAGYLFAWIGHFGVEKNRPATFTYPLESLRADFKMFALMAQGKMDAEIERLQLQLTPEVFVESADEAMQPIIDVEAESV